MAKIDLKKQLKHLYQQSAKEVLQVDVPTLKFLMIDGEGDPNTSQAYAQAVEAPGEVENDHSSADEGPDDPFNPIVRESARSGLAAAADLEDGKDRCYRQSTSKLELR